MVFPRVSFLCPAENCRQCWLRYFQRLTAMFRSLTTLNLAILNSTILNSTTLNSTIPNSKCLVLPRAAPVSTRSVCLRFLATVRKANRWVWFPGFGASLNSIRERYPVVPCLESFPAEFAALPFRPVAWLCPAQALLCLVGASPCEAAESRFPVVESPNVALNFPPARSARRPKPHTKELQIEVSPFSKTYQGLRKMNFSNLSHPNS
jgi:hypothetical protein